jgi:protein-disulfide isomerase-like protein with CxxC motif
MSERTFGVTWDYRCPFARNFHEHVVVALESGADWDVDFVPFSLNQVHVEEGGTDVWDDPAQAAALLAMEAAIVVRDRMPGDFLRVHAALFGARHDAGRDLRDGSVVWEVLEGEGVDSDQVIAEIKSGWPLDEFRKAHERAVSDHQVFGVPTVLVGSEAVFVRVMHRPGGDAGLAKSTVERVLDLAEGWPDLNEFKHTSIPR